MKNHGSKRLRVLPLVVIFHLIVVGAASAKTAVSQFPNIRIKNFGQMDERFYRGAQPDQKDYKDLATLGIKTIIDLRDDPTSYEKREAEAVGIRYVNIPMSDSSRPNDSQIEQFLKLATDPATGAFYVHCVGGRHRTGVAGAVYRMKLNGWDFDRAYKEMKAYDFYTRFGHGSLKTYAQDYYTHLQSIEVSAGQSGISK